MHKKFHRIAIGLSLLVSVMFASPAHAWLAAGHRIIGLMIWQELTPAARTQLSDILKQHPRYKEDLLEGLPQGASEAETQRYAFASAACWPDTVRDQKNPMHFVAHHPEWHYINMPYVTNAENPTTAPAAPEPAKPGQAPRNVIEALAKNESDLANSDLPAAQRALALCWVIHLVGDIHQPLHACDMVSSQFPDGDHGGNLAFVLRDPPYRASQMNLHMLWDGLPGFFDSHQIDGYIAGGLLTDPHYARQNLADLLAVKDTTAWAAESHALAIKYAYLDGKLQVATLKEANTPDARIPGVPPGYVTTAEHVAMKRCIVAAYRGADLLNAAFGEKK